MANLSSELESVQVLEQTWHSKKLNRGTHKANHFKIHLRDIQVGDDTNIDTTKIDAALNIMATNGVPNYFGEQRFGRQGNNIASALEWFEQGTINGRNRIPRRAVTAVTIIVFGSQCHFNQIVSARVEQGNWDKALEGDVFNLNGSGSVFTVEQIDQEIQNRLASSDIHPTAPLWGIKNDKVDAAAKALEQQVVEQNPILQRLAQGLETKELKPCAEPLVCQ